MKNKEKSSQPHAFLINILGRKKSSSNNKMRNPGNSSCVTLFVTSLRAWACHGWLLFSLSLHQRIHVAGQLCYLRPGRPRQGCAEGAGVGHFVYNYHVYAVQGVLVNVPLSTCIIKERRYVYRAHRSSIHPPTHPRRPSPCPRPCH